MLCANRAAIRLSEVLWHSPSIDSISKFGNSRSTQRVLRQHYTYVVLPNVTSGTEVLGRGAEPSNWPLLMQWCSFSQSRVYSNQSEMKEAMNGPDIAQNKRLFEVKGEEIAEKRLRLDSHDPVSEIDEYSVPSYEWQHFDVASVASSRREVVPIYEANSLEVRDESQDSCGLGNIDQAPLEGLTVDETRDALLKRVHKLRPWQYTDLGQSEDRKLDTGVEFTLMSYNILAQDLLESNFYLYGHCDHNVLNWDFRCQNLLVEIEDAQPDILCLQELTQTHYQEYFQPRLSSLGWNSLYKKRTGGKHDGCAVFFKRSLFQLESYVSVEYFKPNIKLLDRDNVGLIVVLKPSGTEARGENTKLCIATTHLLFNPRRGDIKLSQLQLLLAELDKAAFKGLQRNGTCAYHPVILCGDMNSEPYSPLYQLITTGELVYDGLMSGNISGQQEGFNKGKTIYGTDLYLPQLGVTQDCQYTKAISAPFYNRHIPIEDQSSSSTKCRSPSPPGCLRHQFKFTSAYRHVYPSGETPVTTQHRKASCIVDYIFYSSKNCKQKPLHLLGTSRLPTRGEVSRLGGLPNAALSSDHLSLNAKFFLTLSPHKS